MGCNKKKKSTRRKGERGKNPMNMLLMVKVSSSANKLLDQKPKGFITEEGRREQVNTRYFSRMISFLCPVLH